VHDLSTANKEDDLGTGIALITGGAGFIGSHLAPALLARGYRVRVLDSLISQVHGPHGQFPSHLNGEIEWVRGDVCNSKQVSRALEGVDRVFHLAALTGVGQSMYQVDEYTRVNVGGTSTLLQCLIDRKQMLKRLVLSSSRAVYGEGKYACARCGIVYPASRSVSQLDAKQWELTCPSCDGTIHAQPVDERSVCWPGSVYAITKKTQEDLMLCTGKAYDLPVVVLRYFNVYGDGQAPTNPYTGLLITFLARLRGGQPLDLYEDGQMQRDFVHVRDVVAATVTAGERPEAIQQCINVGTGRRITVEQIAKTLVRLTGSSAAAQRLPVARVGDIRHCVADIQRAQELLGYEPHVPLEVGLTELIAWYRHQEPSDDRTQQARLELEQRQLLR
jgi:dTDP-L-rhamnose 4-epimerase